MISIGGFAALLAFGAAGCGDNTVQRECGPGTKVDPGDPNSCIADGTVICGTGTTFNPTTGRCDADSVCPAGTVLDGAECIPSAEPDAEEEAEPNDMNGAGTITVPDVGADGFVIHGCVSPRDGDTTADVDPWILSVDGPTLLEVTADGVHGLAAGFVVQPADPALAALDANGWVRFGVNLSNDTSSRQIFLPAAGSYALVMSDSRQLFLQEAVAGTDQTCYFTTIKQLAIPTPTNLPGNGTATGTIGGEVHFFSTTPTEGELFFNQLDIPSGAANPSLVVMTGGADGTYKVSSDAATPAGMRFGGSKSSDAPLVFAVDTRYNYAIAPVDFTLGIFRVQAAGALPLAGGNSVVTQGDGEFDTFDDIAFYYFDVNDGDIVHLDVSFDVDANFMIVNSALDFGGYTGTVNYVPDLGSTSAEGPGGSGFYRFPVGGRYYVAVFGPDLASGDTLTMTSSLTKMTVDPITVGTPITDRALGALDTQWFGFDPSAQTWIATTASGTGFGGNVLVDYYPTTGAGLVDTDFIRLSRETYNPNGSQTRGHITFGDPTKYVVRVTDSGTGTTPTFTLSVAARVFTNLGLVTDSSPVNKAGEDLGAANAKKLYFARVNAGDTLTVTVHPTAGTFNPTIAMLDAFEATPGPINDGAAGADEVVTLGAPATKWIAFVVSGAGSTTAYDLSITAVSPVPYTITTGTLAFSDACTGTGSETVTLNPDSGSFPADDEGTSDPQTMPFAFSLFGEDVTGYTISSNGWLAFGTFTDAAFANAAIPTADDPNGVVAPFWTDMANVVVCKKTETDKVTIQWTGDSFFGLGPPVATQAIFHNNGVIDFIWGAAQADDGNDATVGLENLAGTYGHQIVFNTANTIRPNTSRTLTPQP